MSILTQTLPPSPTFTPSSLPDLTGRVYIVTGAASGVGLELAKLLYSKDSTVHIGARSLARANTGIEAIRKAHISSTGRLEPFVVDLLDLDTVKAAVESFLAGEERLDVLVHNAAVMTPPAGSKTNVGHDLEMGTDSLGPFLTTQLLLPILRKTAAVGKEQSTAVRVVASWVGNYMQSKSGNVLLASELAKRCGKDVIVSVSLHPGLMKTELQRHQPALVSKVTGVAFKSPVYGAHMELFAGWSPDITQEDNGSFIIPWGRFGEIPCHMQPAFKTKAEGGSGIAERFYEWCERETKTLL